MRDQLRALAKLSEIDSSAMEFDAELREIPKRIEDMRSDVQRLEQLLEKEREQLSDAEKLKKTQEDEISRAKAKGAKARTPKEADAAEREVESNRRAIKEREDEVLRLDEVIEKVRGQIEQHEKELAEFREMFEQEERTAQQRIAELEAERSKVLAGRDEVAAKVPRQILSRYDRLKTKLGTGVAIIHDDRCTACSMALPPQQFIQVQRGEDVQQCPSCLRILLYKPNVED